MVADGLILPADAERIARSRTQRFEHPLELIAEQKLKSLKAAAQAADCSSRSSNGSPASSGFRTCTSIR